jgi:hypothetical protein
MTEEHAAAPAAEIARIPSLTRLVGFDEYLISPDDARAHKAFDGHKVFQHGEEIPVDPPGTVAIVRGSRTYEAEDGKLVLDYVVQLKQAGNDTDQP